jgi:hypothetical protein
VGPTGASTGALITDEKEMAEVAEPEPAEPVAEPAPEEPEEPAEGGQREAPLEEAREGGDDRGGPQPGGEG